MATKSTTSTKFVYLETFVATGLSIRVENSRSSSGPAEIQFREVFDDHKTLKAGASTTHVVLPYTEVWFRSTTGARVTVSSSWDTGLAPTLKEDVKANLAKLAKAKRKRLAKLGGVK